MATSTSMSINPAESIPLNIDFREDVIRIGVIGYGYWGPNIVRNFHGQEHSRVVSVCDKSPKSVQRVLHSYPEMLVTSDYNELLRATDIDAVAIVTPVWTHYELAKAALENGKHVFVEKPFTSSAAQAEELIELADRKNLKIMVDHTFLFTGAVKQNPPVDRRRDPRRSSTTTIPQRVNLGLFQHDVNVIWDLAPHDLSIMDYLIKTKPEAIVATGREARRTAIEDMAYHHASTSRTTSSPTST